MDAKARRLLWNDITSLIKENRIVILTSHSMEECEALCTRLVIMVNGRFKCLGSPQHLKTKFGSGFKLTIRLEDENNKNTLFKFISKHFPQSRIQESHKNLFEFILPFSSTKLSNIFNKMEKYRHQLKIKDYSISQTTLDQVFINFAKLQKEDPFAEESQHAMEQLEQGLVKSDSDASLTNYALRADLEGEEKKSRRSSQLSQGLNKSNRTIYKSVIESDSISPNKANKSSSSRRGSETSLIFKDLKPEDLDNRKRYSFDSNNNITTVNGRKLSVEQIPSVFILPLQDENTRRNSRNEFNNDSNTLGL